MSASPAASAPNTDTASSAGPAEAATPTGRLGRIRSLPVLRPLADRDYRIFWGGESISVLGDQFHFVALAWLVLQMTGSGLALGTVLTAAAIPRVILMLLGGAMADRIEPKMLIFRSNALRALVVGIVAALIITGRVEVWQLVVMAVVFGAVDAFFYPAVSTFLPLLVPSERLTAANGLFQATSQLIGLIGPAVAGITVALIGTSLAFVLDAASFAVAAIAITLVHGGLRAAAGRTTDATIEAVPSPGATAAAAPASDASEARASVWQSIREGASYTFRDPALRTLIILAAALNFSFTGPISIGLPWLAGNRFDAGAAGFGIMISGFGAGALIGAVLAGSVKPFRHRGAMLLGLAALLGLGLGLIGIAPNVLVVTGLMFAMGLGVGFINVNVVTWVQQRTETVILGRVMSLLMLGSQGMAPLSLVVTGVLIDIQPTFVFVAAGVLILIAVGLGMLWRADRLLGADSGPATA
ncbi:MAG: MFS transporter [Candidatus Limnocylindrales bacterium]